MDKSTPSFSLETTIQLPGTVGGHGDWVAYDPATHTVWLSQSPDNNVVVIDTRTNTVKATISGVDDANGIAIGPQYAYVADPTNNVVDVIDKHTYQIVAKVPATGTTLDSVTYVAATHQVYVASDDNNVLDAISAKPPFAQTASYTLTPSSTGPDVATYAKGLIYIPDGTQVDAINPVNGQILASPTLVSSGAVKPGVYDPVTNRFFFGSTNDQIEVVSGSGKGGIGSVVGTINLAGSTDEAAIDVRSRLAFFGDKVGQVDVVNLDSMKVVATLPAETGMHTLTVDPRTHELYVYENNRNVVDVWKYGNGDIVQAGGPGIHVGSPGQMGFSAGAAGSVQAGFGQQSWADALQAAAGATLDASGSTGSAPGAYPDTSPRGGVLSAMDQFATKAAHGVLTALAHAG